MCKNATTQVSNLMAAERPTLVGLMEATGVPADTQATTLAAYDAAQEALANWKPGTTSVTLVEALNAALAVVSSLSNIIPPEAEVLLGIVIAGIEAVIGLVAANSTKDKSAQGQAADAAMAKVQTHVPGFKLGFFDKAKAELGDTNVAANHYKSEWNKAVTAVGADHPEYETLKQS
jgi:hypothetical protein